MPSTQTDRIDGLSTSVAIKARALYTTTGNITLSGLGVQAGGDWGATLDDKTRILVKDQTDPVDNGVWLASAGAWTRARDFDGNRDVTQGTLVFVYGGETLGRRAYHVTTEDPVVIGTSELTWELWPEIASTAELVGYRNRTVYDRLSDLITINDFNTSGLDADGVDDWQSVFEAAAASSYHSIYVPQGKYLLGTGNISVVEQKFWSQSGKDVSTPYGQTGAVIYTEQTTNPVFILGNGGIIDGLQFFYPDQDGSTITDVSSYPTITGAPITYPPTIKGDEAGISGFELRNLTFINAYDCIELGDPAYLTGTGRGTISNIDAFPIYKFLTIYNGLAEIIVSDFVLSPIVYQDIANTGDAALRKWAYQNSKHFVLHRADGLMVDRGTSLGARRCIEVNDKALTFVRFSNILFDQTSQVMVASHILSNVRFSNIQIYGDTIYTPDETTVDLIVFNSATSAAGFGDVSFDGLQVQRCLGSVFNLLTANCVDRLRISNSRFYGWASGAAVAAKRGAIAVDAAATGIRLAVSDTGFDNSNTSYGCGMLVYAGTRVKVSDCDFAACQSEIESSGTTQLRITGCISESTQGSYSTNIGSTSLIERNNVWSKPATTKATSEPWFTAIQSSGQSTSGTTPLTMIYQSENRDGDSSFVAGTGTFTCKTPGSYSINANLAHAGGTAGDVFLIELVTTLLTYRKQYTMPATADSVDIGSPCVDMRVGDTAFVQITRASGSGVFTTSGSGAENQFSGRLID